MLVALGAKKINFQAWPSLQTGRNVNLPFKSFGGMVVKHSKREKRRRLDTFTSWQPPLI